MSIEEANEMFGRACRNTSLEEASRSPKSIMPAMLEKAEEGRKARFNKYLEAHLREFWSGWPYPDSWASEPHDPLQLIYDRKAPDGVNYEKDLPNGGKLTTLVHV